MNGVTRWLLVLAVALVAAYGVSSTTRAAPATRTCKAARCRPTATPLPTATSTATATPSPTATPTATVAPTATATTSATLIITYMSPWYLPDSTGDVSTVNATMMWDGDANQSSPLPTGTLTTQVDDSSCPSRGCIYTHTITAADYQWDPAAGGWSIHYAFSLGTEYPPTDAFFIDYSGDNTFAPSSAQAIDT